MKWNGWVKLLFPILVQLLGALVPAIGGALGGPIGWIATFLLTQGVAVLADLGERLQRFGAIDEKVLEQVRALKETTLAFFVLEDAKANGLPYDKEAREAAKKAMKDKARELVKAYGKPKPEVKKEEEK